MKKVYKSLLFMLLLSERMLLAFKNVKIKNYILIIWIRIESTDSNKIKIRETNKKEEKKRIKEKKSSN